MQNETRLVFIIVKINLNMKNDNDFFSFSSDYGILKSKTLRKQLVVLRGFVYVVLSKVNAR